MLFYACGGEDWAWQPDVYHALHPEKENRRVLVCVHACVCVCVCARVCERKRHTVLERKICFCVLTIKFHFENLTHIE